MFDGISKIVDKGVDGYCGILFMFGIMMLTVMVIAFIEYGIPAIMSKF